MNVIVNVLLVLVGAFLADFTAMLLTQLSPARRVALGATGLVGFALLLARVPFDADPRVGILASAGYAIAACTAVVSLCVGLVQGQDRKSFRLVGMTMAMSLAVMVGLLVWVNTIASSG